MKLRINKDKKTLNLWITQVFIIWLLYVNYAVFIFPNYLFPFSAVSLIKIFVSALISLLIVAVVFCPSILIRKEKAEAFLHYKRKIKYNNRAIIGALYIYKFIYWLMGAYKESAFEIGIKEQILHILFVALFAFFGAFPDIVILYLSKKLAFRLWDDRDIKQINKK
jgi:hypothetical protein